MASSISLRRTTTAAAKLGKALRLFSSSATSHHNHHSQNHEYLEPSPFVSSWVPPKDPAEAERGLRRLRRDYAKQVKSLRKDYAAEVEVARLEKLRRDEARREAQRLVNDERKRLKAQARQARDLEYKTFQEELRLTLAKEKEEKFEYWKMREQRVQEKKKEESELTRRKSSMWIEPGEIEQKIFEAIAAHNTSFDDHLPSRS